MAVPAESAPGRYATLQPKIPLPGERAGLATREGTLPTVRNVQLQGSSTDLLGEQ